MTTSPATSSAATSVEFYVDPSCPWAWITSRWIKEVAPARNLDVTWRSYCLEIRDDYGAAPAVPPERRGEVIAAHAVSHRMLRIFEAVRARDGEDAVDRLYTSWGPKFFVRDRLADDAILAALVGDPDVRAAADDEKWDGPIIESMEVAYAFGGPKTQTPTIVIRSDPPHGFKGPVMSVAPTGDAALRLWDALVTISAEPGVFEFTRPRSTPPRVRF